MFSEFLTVILSIVRHFGTEGHLNLIKTLLILRKNNKQNNVTFKTNYSEISFFHQPIFF